VLEHYVPRGYLRHFAPNDSDVISRYSLVEKHGGGDYYPPRERYPIKKAAALEDFAEGWLETDDTSYAEREMIESVRKLSTDEKLTEDDIAGISTFIAFQHSRTPKSKLFYFARQRISHLLDENRPELPDKYESEWKNAVVHNVEQGSQAFQFMGWRIVENHTDIPFITSDKPDIHYFQADFEDVSSTSTQMRGREIFMPLDADHTLIMLDPESFRVEGQHPGTEVERLQISDRKEIHKLNLLQGVNAFQEVFGPVGEGTYLKEIIEVLTEYYPHENCIRGNQGDLETLMRATELASKNKSNAEQKLYEQEYKSTIQARRYKTHAIWMLNHNLRFVDNLRRRDPVEGHWEEIFL